MPSTPPVQQDGKAVTGKRPPTRKRKQIRRSPQSRGKRPHLIPPLSMTHPEPLSLRDMRKLRLKTGFSVPVSEIGRVCQEMLRGMEPGWQVDHFLEFRIEPEALSLLQREAERFIVERLMAAKACAGHAGRTTMQVKDLQIVDMVHETFKKLGRSFGAKA